MNFAVIVVDDCSTDSTKQELDKLASSRLNLVSQRNTNNLGHGPSTISGLNIAVSWNPQFVIAVDGDGQFFGKDLRKVYDELRRGQIRIVEGVRGHQDVPLFRKAVSFMVRVLVGIRCSAIPQDANTPLRGYRTEALKEILAFLPDDAMTPNLLISAIARSERVNIIEVPVATRSRRGPVQQGSTWGRPMSDYLPSRIFLRFCSRALYQWFSLRNVSKGRRASKRS